MSQARAFSMANHARLLFTVAAALSLMVHLGLAWQYADESFIWMDPNKLGQEQELFLVNRAPQQDMVVDEPLDATDISSEDAGADKPTDMALLSLALLDDTPPKAPTQQTPGEPELRQMVDSRAVEDLSLMPAGLPEVNLPQSVQRAMAVQLPLEVKFNTLPVGGGTGDGDGRNSLAVASGNARGILLGSGLVSGWAPKPRALKPPEFAERRLVTVDKVTLDVPLEMPAVDFTELAMSGATKVNIPEKLDHDFDYHITRYLPTANQNAGWFTRGTAGVDDRGYFQVDIVPRKSLKRLPTMPKDVVILIDTSGSVPQTWVDQVVRGVRDSLSTLGKDDRFNIVFFNENPVFFSSSQIQPATEENLAKARLFLKDRKSKGYTDVNHALTRLLVRDLEVARVYNMIMISDGRPTRGVMDTRELINLITRDNDLVASIYCVGVSGRQNRSLLEFLAYRNKGFCVFAENEVGVAQVIRDLMSRLRYPIMKDVRMSLLGIDPEDVYPRELANLYQGERFVVYGRFDRNHKFTMRLVGHNGRRVLDLTFSKKISDATPADKKMAYDWAFWKLHHLYSEMFRRGHTDQVKAQIEALRKQYKLKTLY